MPVEREQEGLKISLSFLSGVQRRVQEHKAAREVHICPEWQDTLRPASNRCFTTPSREIIAGIGTSDGQPTRNASTNAGRIERTSEYVDKETYQFGNKPNRGKAENDWLLMSVWGSMSTGLFSKSKLGQFRNLYNARGCSSVQSSALSPGRRPLLVRPYHLKGANQSLLTNAQGCRPSCNEPVDVQALAYRRPAHVQGWCTQFSSCSPCGSGGASSDDSTELHDTLIPSPDEVIGYLELRMASCLHPTRNIMILQGEPSLETYLVAVLDNLEVLNVFLVSLGVPPQTETLIFGGDPVMARARKAILSQAKIADMFMSRALEFIEHHENRDRAGPVVRASAASFAQDAKLALQCEVGEIEFVDFFTSFLRHCDTYRAEIWNKVLVKPGMEQKWISLEMFKTTVTTPDGDTWDTILVERKVAP
ncbi:hypothetical protein OBBRIDRAFT_868341 [Obba rivulosa]|uniref:Uncharacterized protein n=1 Tax=Obba rivulosa TaxID=1052685 RepID=A0A8E2B2D4_9APHY|nr:hypothetical protein OBBRIDRAFT_868341 [Obba rivulosa]